MLLYIVLYCQSTVPSPHLPVLYYIVQIYNSSGYGIAMQLNTTTMNTSLKAPGHTYYIVVYAVNVVGEGPNITITGYNYSILMCAVIYFSHQFQIHPALVKLPHQKVPSPSHVSTHTL